MRFEDKVAAITGAGQGLGAGFAKAFAKEGAVAVLIGRTGGKLQAVAEEIRKEGGRALVKVCDIAVPEQVEQCFREIEQEAGNVDVLVNNAAYHKSVPVVETSNEEWLSQISINLNGTFFCTKAVLPAMIRNRYGKIINISSSAAKHFFPGFGAYAASKGGIVSFTHTLSEEVRILSGRITESRRLDNPFCSSPVMISRLRRKNPSAAINTILNNSCPSTESGIYPSLSYYL